MSAKWSVLAVYEGQSARQAAAKFCDELVQRFWRELDFQVSWYAWSDLEDPVVAQEAHQKAGEAELIIMPTPQSGTFPPHIENWIELALRERKDREGVLAGLAASDTGISAKTAATQVYLRKLAHQSGLDYLTESPHSLPQPEPESVDSYSLRASQVTSLLDTILRQSSLPPRTP